jgi:hypothetical protein
LGRCDVAGAIGRGRGPEQHHEVRAYEPTRHGENSGQVFKAAAAHAGVLSVWHVVHGFGIFRRSAWAGTMNLNVWLRTITSPSICAIFGMWQLTQSLPADPGWWCVCCSVVPVCGPFGDLGPWQVRQTRRADLIRSALFGVPCGSWQLAHVTPRVYIRLWMKALHPILAGGAVRKMQRVGRTEGVVIEPPEVRQTQTDAESHGPMKLAVVDRGAGVPFGMRSLR